MRRLLIALSLLAVTSPVSAQTSCSASLQSLVDAAANGATVDVPACTYHELVYVTRPMTLDGHNQAVIEGDNRTNWIAIMASDVTVRNFTMHGGNVADGQGGIATWTDGISNVVISGNVLSGTANGAGVGIGATVNSKVLNNVVHDAGQMGINSVGNTGLLIEGNHVFANNTAGVDPGYAAGGIHLIHNVATQVSNNQVDHNAGPGIWCDIGCDGVTIANNSVHDQAFNPIFYEISSNGDIYGNTVQTTPAGPMNWGCIISSSSYAVNIHENTCVDTEPLYALLDRRSDTPVGAGTGNVLQNNRMVRPHGGAATKWWQYDANGPLLAGSNGNVDSGNVVLADLNTPTPVPTAIPTATPLPTAVAKPKCEVEVWLNGVSQGRKRC